MKLLIVSYKANDVTERTLVHLDGRRRFHNHEIIARCVAALDSQVNGEPDFDARTTQYQQDMYDYARRWAAIHKDQAWRSPEKSLNARTLVRFEIHRIDNLLEKQG